MNLITGCDDGFRQAITDSDINNDASSIFIGNTFNIEIIEISSQNKLFHKFVLAHVALIRESWKKSKTRDCHRARRMKLR